MSGKSLLESSLRSLCVLCVSAVEETRATRGITFCALLSRKESGRFIEWVKVVKLTGGGFETEVELTIKAALFEWRIVKVPVSLIPRPRGAHSKIEALRDGMAILGVILAHFRECKKIVWLK